MSRTITIPEKKIEIYTIQEIHEKFPKVFETLKSRRYEELEPCDWSEHLIEMYTSIFDKMGFGEVHFEYSCLSCQGDGACFYHRHKSGERIELSKLLESMNKIEEVAKSEMGGDFLKSFVEIFQGDFPEDKIETLIEWENEGQILLKINKGHMNYTHSHTCDFEDDSRVDDEEFNKWMKDVVDTLKSVYHRFCSLLHKQLHDSLDACTDDNGIINHYEERSMFDANGKEYDLDELDEESAE